MLASLATEIVDNVVQALNLQDLSSLRLVCSKLYRSTLESFARTHFTNRQTDLSFTSLQTLRAISETEHLRHHVRNLSVQIKNTEPDSHVLPVDGLGPDHLGQSLESPRAQMFQEILTRGLLNCRSFGIYGVASPNPWKLDHLIASEAITFVFGIIARTHISVKSFVIDFAYRYPLIDRLDVARNQMSFDRIAEFRAAWASLQDLSLKCLLTSSSIPKTFDAFAGPVSLRMLCLYFNHDNTASFLNLLLSSAHRLQRLQHFELGNAYTNTSVVSELLENFNTSLCVLSFSSIVLRLGDSWIDIFRLLQKDFPALHSISIQELKETIWTGGQTTVKFPLLASNPIVPGSTETTVQEFHLRTDSRLLNVIESPIRLTHALDPGEAGVIGFQYQGSDMSVVLSIAADAAVAVVSPRATSDSSVQYHIRIRGTQTLL